MTKIEPHGLDYTIVIRPPRKPYAPVTILSYKDGKRVAATSSANSRANILYAVDHEMRAMNVKEKLS